MSGTLGLFGALMSQPNAQSVVDYMRMAKIQQYQQQLLQRGFDRNGYHWQSAQAAYSNSIGQPGAIDLRTSWDASTAWARSYIAGEIARLEAERKPIPHAGIRAGEIIAWRAWTVRGGLLTSVYMGTAWMPGDVMQGQPGIAAGDFEGVYAWKTEPRAREYGTPHHSRRCPVVLGTVKLWGEVAEHEYGYRAEYAGVNSLDFYIDRRRKWEWWLDRRRHKKRLDALRSKYGLEG